MKDKAAIIEAAQKFAAKGQIDKSIAELEKLLKEGRDVNIYNAIGDLYLKKGAQKEAVEFFTKAANSYKEDGFALKAVALYKKILNILPADPEALISLATLNAEKGITADAIENFIKAAEIYYRNGKPEKTLDLYEKVLQLSPSDVNMQLRIIELYLSMGLKEKAVSTCSFAASVFLEKGDSVRARELFNKVLEIDPQNIPALTGFSRMAEKENDFDNALEYLSKALSFTPDHKEILLNYANLAIRINKPDNARTALLKLIEIEPSDTQSKKLLGSLYLKSGDIRNAWRELLPCIEESMKERNWDEARELLWNFRELYPIPVRERIISVLREKNDKQALLPELKELAALYEETGSHKESLQLYKEAVEADPQDTVLQNNIARLENILNPALRQTEIIAGKDSHDLTAEANTEIATESDRDIESIFGKLGASCEEDYESHYTAGVDYKQRGLLDDAIREFQIAAEAPQMNLLSLRMIAFCHMEQKAYPQAIGDFNSLLNKLPVQDERLLDIKYELAGAYFNNNNYTKALELYLEIQSRNPGFRDVAQKIKALNAQPQTAPEKPRPKKDRVSYI